MCPKVASKDKDPPRHIRYPMTKPTKNAAPQHEQRNPSGEEKKMREEADQETRVSKVETKRNTRRSLFSPKTHLKHTGDHVVCRYVPVQVSLNRDGCSGCADQDQNAAASGDGTGPHGP